MTPPSDRCGPLHVQRLGEGPVLLLVHGFPLDHTMWQGQIADLSQSFCVIAPDLRGFGQSPVTHGEVTMDQMAGDLAELLDRLNIHQPICLCGLSMGGYVAWQFWSRFAPRLSRLILCDTRAAADTVEVARGRLLMAQTVENEGPAQVAEIMLPKLFSPTAFAEQPQLVEQTRDVILRTSPHGIAAAQRGMAQRPDMTGRLSQIDVPTLVVCGQYDVISPPSEMQQLAQAMPRARYVEIPCAGHMAPLEQPAAVNAAIGEFLASVPASS